MNTSGRKVRVHKKWRLYADNNIEKEIVRFLREEDFDVLFVAEDAALRHHEDEFHYARAKQLDRYLLTHDADFWDDKLFPLQQSPGLIIVPENEEGMAKYFPILLRKIVEQDYNLDGGARHLGGGKFRLTWDGMSYKLRQADGSQTGDNVSWIALGYKRK